MRNLRKYEYSENTKEYLELLDKGVLYMDKAFLKQCQSWYPMILKYCIDLQLDLTGYYYVLSLLENMKAPIDKDSMMEIDLYLSARHYSNTLTLKGSTVYARKLRELGLSDKELNDQYGIQAKKVIDRLLTYTALQLMKLNLIYLKYIREHCFPIVSEKKTCLLYFKRDMSKALADRDFRVSYTKVNKKLVRVLGKI